MLGRPQAKRVRRYALTWFQVPVDWDSKACFTIANVQLLAGQYETCPESGRRHVQAYVVFENAIGLGGAKVRLGMPTAHFEQCRNTHQANLEYVSKEATRIPGTVPFVYGEVPPGQGARTDISGCKDILDAGGSLFEVAPSDFSSFCKYHRAFRLYESIRVNPRNTAPEVHYHWGASGSGKTRAVWASVEDSALIYPAPLSPTGSAQWFDGYRHDWHTVILLDDYYHNWKLTFFLQFLDRYPMYLPVKGSYSTLPNCTVHTTSNISHD